MSNHVDAHPGTLVEALAAHSRALAACRRCALGPGIVPVVSDARAPRILLVGQAPGKSETSAGRAFLGPAGKTLFRWFAGAGLDEASARDAIHIAAITRCYPGPHPAGRGDRVPSPAERERCAPWLDAELAIIWPALVIPVGRLAIDRMLGTAALADLVGRVHVSPEHRRRILPLPHPSGASGWLNDPRNRDLLDSAIELLRGELARLGLVERPGDARSAA